MSEENTVKMSEEENAAKMSESEKDIVQISESEKDIVQTSEAENSVQLSEEEIAVQLSEEENAVEMSEEENAVEMSEEENSVQMSEEENSVQMSEEENISVENLSVQSDQTTNFVVDESLQQDAPSDEEELLSSIDSATSTLILNEQSPENRPSDKDLKSTLFNKPYIGGYRNKLTGIIYHHATAQTLPPPRKYPPVERFCRECQTVVHKNQYQQTSYNVCTQVEVTGIYISNRNDRIMSSTYSYISADEILSKLLLSVLVVQKYLRGWLAKREVSRMRADLLRRIKWEQDQELLRQKEEEDWLMRQYERRRHPQNKDDFMLLLSDLKKWWEEEVKKEEKAKSGAEFKAALCGIADEEIEYLQSIEIQRQEFSRALRDKRRFNLLYRAALPKRWKGYKGEVLVETAGTLRSRTLQTIYYSLSLQNINKKERLDILTTLKGIIKEHSCPLTKELMSLVNREVDMLMRNMPEKYLEGLRMRISTLFWSYCRQPAFNPEAIRFSKIAGDPLTLSKAIINCTGCGSYYIQPESKRAGEGSVGANVFSNRFLKCENCKYAENEGWMRKENEVFKRMLKLLKAREKELGTSSGLVSLLRVSDVSYLVEKIWNQQSGLSGGDVIKDLELVRWNQKLDWTPWNCALLTRKEAIVHYQIEKPEKMYHEEFIQAVQFKHLAARTYFATIPRMIPYLSASNN